MIKCNMCRNTLISSSSICLACGTYIETINCEKSNRNSKKNKSKKYRLIIIIPLLILLVISLTIAAIISIPDEWLEIDEDTIYSLSKTEENLLIAGEYIDFTDIHGNKLYPKLNKINVWKNEKAYGFSKHIGVETLDEISDGKYSLFIADKINDQYYQSKLIDFEIKNQKINSSEELKTIILYQSEIISTIDSNILNDIDEASVLAAIFEKREHSRSYIGNISVDIDGNIYLSPNHLNIGEYFLYVYTLDDDLYSDSGFIEFTVGENNSNSIDKNIKLNKIQAIFKPSNEDIGENIIYTIQNETLTVNERNQTNKDMKLSNLEDGLYTVNIKSSNPDKYEEIATYKFEIENSSVIGDNIFIFDLIPKTK